METPPMTQPQASRDEDAAAVSIHSIQPAVHSTHTAGWSLCFSDQDQDLPQPTSPTLSCSRNYTCYNFLLILFSLHLAYMYSRHHWEGWILQFERISILSVSKKVSKLGPEFWIHSFTCRVSRKISPTSSPELLILFSFSLNPRWYLSICYISHIYICVWVWVGVCVYRFLASPSPTPSHKPSGMYMPPWSSPCLEV